jgi:hypothetical protein
MRPSKCRTLKASSTLKNKQAVSGKKEFFNSYALSRQLSCTLRDMLGTTLWLFFPIAISLHNLEEALWLPEWSKQAKRFQKPVGANEFRFAVIIITLLAYLATFVALVSPAIWLAREIFFGFLGAMILNAFIPHLAATLALRRYAPGLVTGLLLLVPVNTTIIVTAMKSGQLMWPELLLSTAFVAGALLALIPVLFRLGRLCIG